RYMYVQQHSRRLILGKRGVRMKFSTRFIKFFGGPNLLFTLITLILIGIVFFIFNKVSFIFHPFIVILSTVEPPAIIAFIVYFLMIPLVNVLEKLRIKRLWGIIITILGFHVDLDRKSTLLNSSHFSFSY